MIQSSKDIILNSVKKNKHSSLIPYPTLTTFPKSDRPLLEVFQENLTIGAGTYHTVNSIDEVNDLIKKLHPDAKVICSATPEVKGNKDLQEIKDPHDLADVDVGVIRAKFGVAETGMIWLTQEDLQMDALGFLSQHLVILLHPDELVRDMPEAYAKIDLGATNYGCFMYGPSATGDIGAVMVRGAQGARTLAVVYI